MVVRIVVVAIVTKSLTLNGGRTCVTLGDYLSSAASNLFTIVITIEELYFKH